jgi:predicted nucleic acid-binding protein
MSGALIDTNVLVYAHDRSEPKKQRRARAVLEGLADLREVYLSTQVLGEFFRVVTRKLVSPLTVAQARTQVLALRDLWVVLPVTDAIVVEAVRGVGAHDLSYWDAQLWATARLNQLDIVLTEDFEDGRTIETIRFVDPFAAGFEVR